MKVNRPSDKEANGLACQYVNGEWHAYNPRHLPVIPLLVGFETIGPDGFYADGPVNAVQIWQRHIGANGGVYHHRIEHSGLWVKQ